ALMRHARIIILRIEGYYHEVDEPLSSTTETTYQDKTVLAFTPATTGDYLVLASCSITGDRTDKHFYTRLTYDGVSQGEIVREPTVAGNYHSYQIVRVITATSTSHTLKIQYKSEAKPTATATIKNARISAVRLSDLGIDAYYTEAEDASTTTSTSYVDKATLSFSPSPPQYGDYLVMGFCLLKGDKTAKKAYARLLIDSESYSERSFRPDTVSDCIPLFAFKKYRTSPGSHTIGLQYKTEAPMKVTCQNARILAIKVNTLESYSDAGITPSHTFDSASHTVHIYGYGYQYYWEAPTPIGMPYQVVYYDADGIMIYSHSIESNLNRSLSSSYDLRADAGAKAGTWHAVVYRAKEGDPSPAAAYTPNDSNSIMEVEFIVEESAISVASPEVATNNATGVGTTSATLNGSLTSLGSYSSAYVSFEWGTTSGALDQETTPVSKDSTSDFSADLTGLASNTPYYFRAKAVADGTTVYGAELNFTTGKEAPTVTTTAATNVCSNSTTLNGSLASLGDYSSVDVSFQWGTTTAYGNEIAAGTMNSTGPFSANLTGLTADTTYYFRAKGKANGTFVYGSEWSFTTTEKLAVATGAASNITANSATLNGTLTSLGGYNSAYVSFEWGTNSMALDWKTTPVSMNCTGPFSADLPDLESDTTYYFRAKAVADNTTAYGSELSFTTAKENPAVTTNSADNVATTSAALNGTLDSLGDYGSADVSFEWGTTSGALDQGTTPVLKDSIGDFSVALTGLASNTTYYFRAKAVADGTTVYGSEWSFTTDREAPAVTTSAATGVGATAATLNGVLTSLGDYDSVSVSFEWGTTTGYGDEIPAGTMTETGSFSAALTGLLPGTTYHFRAKATGSAIDYGLDITFTTEIAPAAPPTIQRYYTTWENEVSTTSTEWVDPQPKTDFYPLHLTFTPPAEGKYLVMACATLSNSSTSYYTDWQFLRETAGTTTEICRRQYKPRQVGDYVPFGAHNLMTLGSQEYTFKMQFKTENAAGTAYMRHARIMIFRVDGYYHEADESVSSTTETTCQDKAILAFTPPVTGDYLVIASCSMTGSSEDKHFYTRLTYDGVSQGEIVRQPTVAGNYHSYQIMRVITATSISHTLKIQYKSEGGATATIKNPRISAVRLSDLGIDAHYTEVEGASVTTSTSYVDKATLSFSPSPPQYGDYWMTGFCLLNGDSADYAAYARLAIDNVSYGERSFRPATVSDYIPLLAFKKYRTSPGSHTIELQYRTEASSMAVTCQNARLLATKVNTLEPYSDAGITPCHTFDSANHMVHIYGYGYQYNWEAETPTGMPYKVVYYDADGTMIYSDDIVSNLNRSLSSSYNLRTNPAARAGTWHAVVYRAKEGDPSPAATYTPNNSDSVMEVAFNIEQSAITPPATIGEGRDVPYRTIRVDILGEISTLKTTYSGKLSQSYLTSDVAGRCILYFDRGTRIITSEGKIPREIKVTQVAQPPPAGADAVVIIAYDLTAYIYGSTPVAITFDPAARLVMSYNPGELPQNISSLAVAYYDIEQGWIELEPPPGSAVEVGNVTALISRTGTFAILAGLSPSPLPPSPPPS
ncbi:MAG: hypothetical protein U9O84_01245, partial [Chloroflexota bacterium]|nr:hypothetical protein [Chloroflexota bacterium]